MLRNVDALRAEIERLHRSRVSIVPCSGQPAVEVGPGDELQIRYDGKARQIVVLSVEPWGLRVIDRDLSAYRSFRFNKIGIA